MNHSPIDFNAKAVLKPLLTGLIVFFLGACASRPPVQSTQPGKGPSVPTPADAAETVPTTPPEIALSKETSYFKVLDIDLAPSPREFRGIWIATVANIDWPSSPLLPFQKQKEEFTALLDYYEKLNFNAVIVQVRTAGDAFYPSGLAPWSKYLTGKEGQKPLTDEDPLSWMILEAHKRGIEFHAWFNPYRATFDADTKKLSPEHDYNKHPQWMVKYANKYYYNPGLPEVQRHLTEVIREVVRNYDIDAVHFDDYFYPYKVNNEVFNDGEAFKKYGKANQSRDDWRRENVNRLIQSVHRVIKEEKAWVQFGVSPFGVWRNKANDPNGSNTRAGHSNFDDLYADPITWMKNGWIDYLIPQLYWSMDYNLASYRELVSWWSKNSHSAKIYIGNGPYKIRDNADKAWENPMEIPNQVALSRVSPNISGNAYFSAKSLYQKNRDVAEILARNHYSHQVLSPGFVPSRNLEINGPEQIILKPSDQGILLEFDQSIDPGFRYALIYTASKLQDLSTKSPALRVHKIYLDQNSRKQIPIPSMPGEKYLGISFLDRFGRESKAVVMEIQTKNSIP